MNLQKKIFGKKEPALNKPVVMRSLFCIGYKGFGRVTNFIKLMPYPIRWTYWTALYYYNKYRFPSGNFTLELYRSYAK
jgi:hypothetical protein